ncbi:MAG: DUF3667 domain-containing protein [Bacteroidota bacterium]
MEDRFTQACRNCQAPLSPSIRFCPHCGQKNTDGKVTVREMIGEFVNNVFNVDSKLFRTLRDLFIPGKLTDEYFKGRRIHYYHPMRIFIFTGIALFAVMSFKLKNTDQMESVAERSKSHTRKVERGLVYSELDSLKSTISDEKKDPLVSEVLDEYLNRSKLPQVSDSTNIGISSKQLTIQSRYKVATKDLAELSADEIIEKYQIEGLINQVQVKQSIKFMSDGDSLLYFILGNSIWIMLLLMVVFASVLKLVYIRHDFLFVEHLVFSFHTHAFTQLVATFGLLFLFEKPILLVLLLLPSQTIYTYHAMKRLYQQGFWKTNFKYFLVNMLYSAVSLVLVVIGFLVGFVLF